MDVGAGIVVSSNRTKEYSVCPQSCLFSVTQMKKLFNKIEQVLQLVLAAPVKLPGKVGNVLKYLALGLGIVERY